MNLTCNRLILARLWEENEVRSSSQATKKGNKTSGKSGTKLNPHFLTVRFYQVDGQVKTMRILLMFPLQNLSKFLEIPYLLAFSEVERLNAICMNEMPGFQSRVGAPAIKHEFQPFGRLNSCGVSPLQPVLESSALRFFLCKELKLGPFIKSLTRNWSNLLSKIPGLSGRNCLFSLNATNCRGAKPTGPQSYPPKKPPCGTKSLGSFVYLKCTSTKHRKRCLVTGHF